MDKKVYINRGKYCTFGTLSQVWDNGYIKMACIKFPFKTKVSTHSNETVKINYLWCLEEEVNYIYPNINTKSNPSGKTGKLGSVSVSI